MLKFAVACMLAFTLFAFWRNIPSDSNKGRPRRAHRRRGIHDDGAPLYPNFDDSVYDALITPDPEVDGPPDLKDQDPEEEEFMARFRDDWGKGGNGVHLSKKEQELADKEFSKAGFNVYVSDRIPLNRTLMDPRVDPCRTRSYPEDLPSVSVIITFYNEILSALLRTIVSVVNRSPVRILREVVLVDDFSNMTELKGQLYRFLRRRFRPGFVKLLRLPRREGLIRARLAGASAAQGHIIVFLDSHCEATEGWLEPLVDVVNDDPTTIASPIITVIDEHSFTVQVSYICRYVPYGIVTSRDVELHTLLFVRDEKQKKEEGTGNRGML